MPNELDEKNFLEQSKSDFERRVLIKNKHIAVLNCLNGLSISDAKFILDIVIEDITANAIVQSNQLTSPV